MIRRFFSSSSVPIALVKTLRERSGAGIIDCKKALEASEGNLEDAIVWLRKRGIDKAAKKEDRVAAEGVVAIALNETNEWNRGVVLEVNSETDFVARNPEFRQYAQLLAQTAAQASLSVVPDGENAEEALLDLPLGGQSSAKILLKELAGKIGENLTVRRASVLSVPKEEGIIAAYSHGIPEFSDLGSIGVLVSLRSSSSAREIVESAGKRIAMHIAAENPRFLNQETVPEEVMKHEMDILMAQLAESGKPPEIAEKIASGRMRKFFQENCLLEQEYVGEDAEDVAAATKTKKPSISHLLLAESKSANAEIILSAFTRLKLGEGVEARTDDFAEEVRKQAGL